MKRERSHEAERYLREHERERGSHDCVKHEACACAHHQHVQNLGAHQS